MNNDRDRLATISEMIGSRAPSILIWPCGMALRSTLRWALRSSWSARPAHHKAVFGGWIHFYRSVARITRHPEEPAHTAPPAGPRCRRWAAPPVLPVRRSNSNTQPASVPSVGVRQHLVLVDLDNLQHALDGLQVRSLLVPLPLVPQLRRGDHLEQHPRMLPATDHGIRNACRVALLVLRRSATATSDLHSGWPRRRLWSSPARLPRMTPCSGEGAACATIAPLDKLITPGVAERGLVGPQECVGIRELARAIG